MKWSSLWSRRPRFGNQSSVRLNLQPQSEIRKYAMPTTEGSSASGSGPLLAVQDMQRMGVVGHGSGGVVYKVMDRKTSAVYALKVIKMEHCVEEDMKHKMRELKILSKVKSPHIVDCKGVVQIGTDAHVLMEFMEGGDLSSHMTRLGIPSMAIDEAEKHIADIARQLVGGLVDLHTQKIVHRDLKPSNLLVNAVGQVKIADFGMSKELEKTAEECKTFVGTCAYMSPDRFDPDSYGGSYDPYAGDVWSLGIVLLECLLGHCPFHTPGKDAPDWASLLCSICINDPPSPPPSASPHFKSFLAACLQKNPRDRWTAANLVSHPFLNNPKPIRIPTRGNGFLGWLPSYADLGIVKNKRRKLK